MSRVSSIWFMGVVVAVLLLGAIGGAMAQSVVINGVPLVTTRTPVTMAGSMLLPMRDVFEALQSEVKWFASEQKVMAVRGQTTVELWIGRRYAAINGTQVSLPVAPMMIGGSTYVPLRFPAEAFGGTVEWQAATRTALINIPEVGGQPTQPPVVQPPVVQPPVVQPPVVEPPVTPPPALVTYEGTVLQVLATPPSLLLQLAGTGLPQAVPVAPRTAITRGAQGAAPVAVALTEVRAGDYAVATMGADNIADKLAVTYGELQGKVLALANNVLVLDDGTAFRLAENARVVDPTGQAVPLTSVPQNAQVTLGFDPNSRTVWEIRLAVAPPTTPPPTQPTQTVQIMSVGATDASTVYGAGQTVHLRLKGTPGGQATVSVSTLAKNLPMRETDPGTYVAEWLIPEGLDYRTATIFGYLTVGTVQAPRGSSAERIIIDSVPPQLLSVEPDRGTTITNNSPAIVMTFKTTPGTALNANGVTLMVNRRNVTRDTQVEADQITYNAQDLPAGSVNVEAIVRDLAGNEVRPAWSFTIAARPENIIKSVTHDAQRVLVAGDIIHIATVVEKPGAIPTFSIAGLVQDQPMRRVGTTSKYVGAYTVKAGDKISKAAISVKYLDPNGNQAKMDATNKINIDTNLPTALKITKPVDQSAVGDALVVSGEARPYGKVRVTVTYRTRVVTWITGQLWQDTVQTDAKGLWTTPEMDTNVGLFGRADQYIVLAEALDKDGKVTSQQQITLKK